MSFVLRGATCFGTTTFYRLIKTYINAGNILSHAAIAIILGAITVQILIFTAIEYAETTSVFIKTKTNEKAGIKVKKIQKFT